MAYGFVFSSSRKPHAFKTMVLYGFVLSELVPAPAPPRARQRQALLGPSDLAAGKGAWRAILTYTRREDSTSGEDYWTSGTPRVA